MAIIGYARTSTTDQTAGLDDQIAVLTEQKCERIYSEHVSALAMKRPEWAACRGYLRDGDTLIVTKPDRLARSVVHMLGIIEELRGQGIEVRILSMDIDTSTPTGKLTLTLLSAVAEWERSIMLERQKAGIAEAKRAGKYQGRKPALTEEQVAWVRREHAKGRPQVQMMEMLGVSRHTIWRALGGGQGKKEAA